MPDESQFPRNPGPASGQKWKNTIRGNPGEVWTNTGAKVLYQWHCNFANSCGRCIEMANCIGPWWPLPLHHGCTCKNVPIKPGQPAAAFLDYREEIRKLDRAQQRRVIGASNLRLVESGVVPWEDIVQRGRIKTLEEVVSEKRLTVDAMVKAGVSRGRAERAWGRVNTPDHVLVDAKRKELVDRLKAQGLTADEIRRRAAGTLAGRVGIGGGPSGPQTPPRVPPVPPPPPPGPPPKPVGSLANFVVPATPAPATPTAKIDWKAKGWKDAIEEAGKQGGAAIRAKVVEIGDEAAKKRAVIESGTDPDKARRLAELVDETAAKVAEAIRPPGPPLAMRRDDQVGAALLRGTRTKRVPRELEAEVAKGVAFVARVTTDAGRSTPLGYGVAALSGTKRVPRAFHRGTSAFGALAFGDRDRAATVVHELGHAVERQTPGLEGAAAAFRDYRLAGEAQASLKRLFPGHRFDRAETGAKDEFDRVWDTVSAYYVGKRYASGATEVISMGVEQLYRDAATLARLDPEFFDFIVGALHGRW